jgi:hypothetical protein
VDPLFKFDEASRDWTEDGIKREAFGEARSKDSAVGVSVELLCVQGDLARRAGVSAGILQTFNRRTKDGPALPDFESKGWMIAQEGGR